MFYFVNWMPTQHNSEGEIVNSVKVWMMLNVKCFTVKILMIFFMYFDSIGR